MGYVFNTISFWFLSSSEKVLSTVVLEMNNVFGERHAYLVYRDFAAEAKFIQQPVIKDCGTKCHC